MKYPIEDRNIELEDALFIPGKTPDEVMLRVQKETLIIQYKLLTSDMARMLKNIDNIYFKEKKEELKTTRDQIKNMLDLYEKIGKLHDDIERTL